MSPLDNKKFLLTVFVPYVVTQISFKWINYIIMLTYLNLTIALLISRHIQFTISGSTVLLLHINFYCFEIELFQLQLYLETPADLISVDPKLYQYLNQIISIFNERHSAKAILVNISTLVKKKNRDTLFIESTANHKTTLKFNASLPENSVIKIIFDENKISNCSHLN